MSAALDNLARDKESLVMRSALCRVRLRRQANDVKQALHWKRAAVALAAAPDARRIAIGAVFSLVGLARASRYVMLAGRIALVAKLAGAVISYARQVRLARQARTRAVSCGIEKGLVT